MAVYVYLKKNLQKIQQNKNGVQSATVNVMGENDTVKSCYRNRQPNMTRNENKNLTVMEINATKNVQSEMELKLLNIIDKRFERIESRIDELARLKTYDE